MKAGAAHIDRAALKIRAKLMTSWNTFTNQLHRMLKLFGLKMGSATTQGKRRERLGELFTRRFDLRAVITPLIESIEAMKAQLSKSSKLLTDRVTTRRLSGMKAAA